MSGDAGSSLTPTPESINKWKIPHYYKRNNSTPSKASAQTVKNYNNLTKSINPTDKGTNFDTYFDGSPRSSVTGFVDDNKYFSNRTTLIQHCKKPIKPNVKFVNYSGLEENFSRTGSITKDSPIISQKPKNETIDMLSKSVTKKLLSPTSRKPDLQISPTTLNNTMHSPLINSPSIITPSKNSIKRPYIDFLKHDGFYSPTALSKSIRSISNKSNSQENIAQFIPNYIGASNTTSNNDKMEVVPISKQSSTLVKPPIQIDSSGTEPYLQKKNIKILHGRKDENDASIAFSKMFSSKRANTNESISSVPSLPRSSSLEAPTLSEQLSLVKDNSSFTCANSPNSYDGQIYRDSIVSSSNEIFSSGQTFSQNMISQQVNNNNDDEMIYKDKNGEINIGFDMQENFIDIDNNNNNIGSSPKKHKRQQYSISDIYKKRNKASSVYTHKRAHSSNIIGEDILRNRDEPLLSIMEGVKYDSYPMGIYNNIDNNNNNNNSNNIPTQKNNYSNISMIPDDEDMNDNENSALIALKNSSDITNGKKKKIGLGIKWGERQKNKPVENNNNTTTILEDKQFVEGGSNIRPLQNRMKQELALDAHDILNDILQGYSAAMAATNSNKDDKINEITRSDTIDNTPIDSNNNNNEQFPVEFDMDTLDLFLPEDP